VEGVIDFTLCLILLVKWLLNFLCYVVDDFFSVPPFLCNSTSIYSGKEAV
jgi:hypothetical protein